MYVTNEDSERSYNKFLESNWSFIYKKPYKHPNPDISPTEPFINKELLEIIEGNEEELDNRIRCLREGRGYEHVDRFTFNSNSS